MRDHTQLRTLILLMIMTHINRLKAEVFGTSILDFQPSAFSLQPKYLACLLLSATILTPSMTTSASAPSSPTDEVMVQGTQAYQRGAYEDALGKWKEAAQQYEAQSQPSKQSQALVAAALVERFAAGERHVIHDDLEFRETRRDSINDFNHVLRHEDHQPYALLLGLAP